MKATIVGIAPRNNSAKLNVSLNVNILGRHGKPGDYVVDERNYIGVRSRFINRIITSIVGDNIVTSEGITFTLAEAAKTINDGIIKREDKIKFFNQALRGAVVDIQAIEYAAGEVLSFEEAEVEEGEQAEEAETDEVTNEDIVAKYDGVYYKVSTVVLTDLARKIIAAKFAKAI